MIQQLERKFGKYAIPHLMNYIIGGYIVGYVIYMMSMISGQNLISLLTLDPKLVLKGQIWRLISWVLFPPIQNIFFEIIMMIFYWQLGSTLENTWGAFRFNLYMFGGIIFTVIGAFLAYGIIYAMTGLPVSLSGYFSTEYINMSIFLAFALTYPDMQIFLYFIIPIRIKWLALIYALIVGYSFFGSGMAGRIAIAASLLNFFIFWLMTRNHKSISPYEQAKKRMHRRSFGRGGQNTGMFGQNPGRTKGSQRPLNGNPFGSGSVNIARHKCAICGRTDISNPELTFRFCSKCNGNYEYCNDHLFSHEHKA